MTPGKQFALRINSKERHQKKESQKRTHHEGNIPDLDVVEGPLPEQLDLGRAADGDEIFVFLFFDGDGDVLFSDGDGYFFFFGHDF